MEQKQKRTTQRIIWLTESEAKEVDNLQANLKLVNTGKVSRADAVLKAIRFATGNMTLK